MHVREDAPHRFDHPRLVAAGDGPGQCGAKLMRTTDVDAIEHAETVVGCTSFPIRRKMR
jgi:hypothetical protein